MLTPAGRPARRQPRPAGPGGRPPSSGRPAGGSAPHRLRGLIRFSDPARPQRLFSTGPTAIRPSAGQPAGRTSEPAIATAVVRSPIETNAAGEGLAVDAQVLGAR